MPRYRQHVRRVPGRLANPVWVDDENFDLAYHVRRSALPRPGTLDQLRELTARIMSRRLDPDRPLWEIYFVEGLEDGRVALLSKSPPDPRRRHLHGRPRPGAARRRPRPAPARARRLGGPGRADARPGWRLSAVAESVAPPAGGGDARCAATPRRSGRTLERRGGQVGAIAGELSNRRSAPESPFNIEPSAQRRVVLRAHLARRTTARSAGSTAAPSTTSSWPRCRAPSGRG